MRIVIDTRRRDEGDGGRWQARLGVQGAQGGTRWWTGEGAREEDASRAAHEAYWRMGDAQAVDPWKEKRAEKAQAPEPA